MRIRYKSRKLEKTVDSPKNILKHYGTRAKQVKQRLDEIKASENLAVLYKISRANCHLLTGDRKGQLAVDISGNHRIIFLPDHDPVPELEDGGYNRNAITDILIVSIGEDYH